MQPVDRQLDRAMRSNVSNDLALALGMVKRAWFKHTGQRFPEDPQARAEYLADSAIKAPALVELERAASDLRKALALVLQGGTADGPQS